MVRCVLLPLVVACSLVGSDEPHKHVTATAKNDAAAKMLARLKSLAGEWQVVNGADEQNGKTLVSYRVTAGGSAVVEVIFPDSDMEMISVYHRDGKDLVMTHYCMMANQPRMRAQANDDVSRLVFQFTGGTNLDPAKDPHIHGGVIEFVDADHIRSEWDYYAGGKLAEKHSFQLERKR